MFILVGATLLLLVALDQIYYSIHSRSWNIDINRPGLFSGQHFDVIFFGSSRTRHHFDIPILSSDSINAFNFGITGGATIVESYFLCRDFLQRNTTNTVVIELQPPQNTPPQCFDKFRLKRKQQAYRGYFSYYEDSGVHLPFVRFMNPLYDWKKLLFNSLKKSSDLNSQGFVPLEGSGLADYELANSLIECLRYQEWFDKLDKLCSDHKANLIFVIPPRQNGKVKLRSCSDLYILDYQNLLADPKVFRDPLHLNKDGAKELTREFLEDFEVITYD